ncbi:MAG: hypothetical protein EPO68_14685 [Planctomycetota bacterium]|nr:MAG: hypothetical protein EPO68_14685 [Planctomycetota bacterium]
MKRHGHDGQRSGDEPNTIDSRRRFLVFVGCFAASCRDASSGDAIDSLATDRRPPNPTIGVADLNGWSPPPAALRDAWNRAQERGKSLLVILIPPIDSGRARYDAQMFGALLCHGDDATLTALASVELVCATPAECAALARSTCDPDARFAIMDSEQGASPRLRSFRAQLPWGDAMLDDVEKGTRDRLDELCLRVREAIAPAGVAADAAIAAAERSRYQARAPLGSRWASSTGCASLEIEGEVDGARGGIYCGIGHTSEISRRFLWYYEKPWKVGKPAPGR